MGIRSRIVLVSIFSILSGTLFLVVTVFCLFNFRRLISRGDERELFEYKYMELNTLKNESSIGYVLIKKKLDKDEYISYSDTLGIHYLISNFGDEEYTCSGSCHCEDENNNPRKSSAAATGITKGLTYLVAAVSSVIAIKHAKQYFSEECIEEMAGICSVTSRIIPRVEECQTGSSASFENLKGDERDIRTFWCKGKCFKKIFRNDEVIKIQKNFGCEKLTLEEDFEVDCTDEPTICSKIARKVFYSKYLKRFCKNNSVYPFKFKTAKSGVRWRTVYLCASRPTKDRKGGVSCRESPQIVLPIILPELR